MSECDFEVLLVMDIAVITKETPDFTLALDILSQAQIPIATTKHVTKRISV